MKGAVTAQDPEPTSAIETRFGSARCPVIAGDLGCEIGQMILRRSKSAGAEFVAEEDEKTHAEL
jgi:hypothetical protein